MKWIFTYDQLKQIKFLNDYQKQYFIAMFLWIILYMVHVTYGMSPPQNVFFIN